MIMNMQKHFRRVRQLLYVTGSAVAFALAPSQVFAQDAAIEEIVVSGFRQSLEAALDNKRSAINNTESIVAEDIGKMPDLNLAESIQRVPGVAITREGGEGRTISVRGLSPEFTRTTLNGMEIPSSAGGLDSSGGVNRGREVDFNVFASELFNRIDIHKTQRASIEEGGLASTIELFSAKPFDNPGLQISAGAQLTVDNVADELDPRITALFSNTFLDDTLGVLVSIAKSERSVRQEGFGTVRYSSASEQNEDWADTSGTTVIGTPNAAANDVDFDPLTDDPLSYMWMPRLPRMDYFSNTVERTGITAAIQFRPIDALELGLDLIRSKLENERISFNYAAQFRNEWDTITPTSITLDPTGRYIVAGSFENVRPRSESRQQVSETDFEQTVLTGSYDISDSMKLSAMFGRAVSEHDESQFRFNIDGPVGGSDFSFDMRQNSNIAEMTYGFDILDPDQYTIGGGLTLRRDTVERTNDTFRVDLDIDISDSLQARAGLISNTREVDSLRHNPVGVSAPAGNSPANDIPGMTVTFQSQVGGGFASALNPPSGFPTNWMVQHFDTAIAAYGFSDRTFAPQPNDPTSFYVEEETFGIYGEVDYETTLAGMPLRINAGVRLVETDTLARGSAVVSGEVETVEASGNYSDTLPSINTVLELRDDLLLRLNIGKNITRPGLSSLSPRVTSVTPINGNISVGNPDLDPIRATSIDLGIEWYFADEALLALTLFNKDIEGFIASETVQGTLNPGIAAIVAQNPVYDPAAPEFDPGARDPFTDEWNLTTPINSQDADLKGYEITYQQPFSFLPGILANFGIIANYTNVESEADFNGITSSLPGLSEESHNLTVYYETDIWGLRFSQNYRDDYITRVTGSNGNAREFNTGPTRVDMSAFYNATDFLTIRFEVINLLEEEERNYTSGPTGDLNLVREYNSTGREVYLGARVNF